MTLHETVTDANNNVIPGRINDNFGLSGILASTQIASNEITIDSELVIISNSGSIENIEGGIIGQRLLIKSASGIDAVVIKDTATKNIKIFNADDGAVYLTNENMAIELLKVDDSIAPGDKNWNVINIYA